MHFMQIESVLQTKNRSELAKNRFSVALLAGNEDMHKISDEFGFRSDQTTDYGVSCP